MAPAPSVRTSSDARALAAPVGPIVVDAARRMAVAEAFAEAEERPPDAAELRRALDAWVEEEVLFREGLRRGLERDDPKVRQRVAAKLLTVLRATIVLPEPTEAELQAHHAAHRERWDQPALVDFVQVFVAGQDAAAKDRAAKLLSTLRAGADPGGLGDSFPGGRRYRRRPLAELAETFGDTFIAGLGEASEGVWQLRESRFGLHLVRIDRRTQEDNPPFAKVRADVAGDYELQQRDAELITRLRELRAQHEVRVLR